MPKPRTKRERVERDGPTVDHPELLVDQGCYFSPSCLKCPLPRCRYDVRADEIDQLQAA